MACVRYVMLLLKSYVVIGFLFAQAAISVRMLFTEMTITYCQDSKQVRIQEWIDLAFIYLMGRQGGGGKNLQTLSMYLLNGPQTRHWSPAEQLLNCSYLTINHCIFGPYSLLCSGCNCKPVIIGDVGNMGQGGRWERVCPPKFWQIS